MWNSKKSRAGFFRSHPRPAEFHSVHTHILGDPLPNGVNGNFALLDRIIGSLRVENIPPGKSPSQLFCGLMPAGNSYAESAIVKGGAWIGIGPQCVELADKFSTSVGVFPEYLRFVMSQSPQRAQRALEGARGSFFRFVGADFPGEHQTYPDDRDVWMARRDHDLELCDSEAAVRWAIGHELGHLLYEGPKSADKAARAHRADSVREMLGPMWPTRQLHQDEILADHASVQILGSAASDSADLEAVIRGSILATLAVGFEGWFLDRSSISSTHPSPFLRALALRGFWLDYLNSRSTVSDARVRELTASRLLGIAELLIAVEWVAGEYGESRAGSNGLLDDLDTTHGLLMGVCTATR